MAGKMAVQIAQSSCVARSRSIEHVDSAAGVAAMRSDDRERS